MPFKLPILLNFQGSTHRFGVGSFSNIVFYDVIDKRKQTTDDESKKQQAVNRVKKSRHILLEKEHVIVKPLILGQDYGNYEEAYMAAIEDIRVNGIDGNIKSLVHMN